MQDREQTFVLVHGAWHGGWCWDLVASTLRQAGHRVTTPTLTGLGERHHLLTPAVDLETMVGDIVQHLHYEGLSDVRLVGHSFGGPVISGVANKVPGRLKDLTFLDSLWLVDGQAPIDLLSTDVRAARLASTQSFDGGLSFPVPPVEAFGVAGGSNDPGIRSTAAAVALLQDRLTPHPVASYLSPLSLPGGPTNGLPARYVVCTDPLYGPVARSQSLAAEAGLKMVELAAPHDAMVTHPTQTAGVLMG